MIYISPYHNTAHKNGNVMICENVEEIIIKSLSIMTNVENDSKSFRVDGKVNYNGSGISRRIGIEINMRMRKVVINIDEDTSDRQDIERIERSGGATVRNVQSKVIVFNLMEKNDIGVVKRIEFQNSRSLF